MSRVRKIENNTTKLFMIIFVVVLVVVLGIIVGISIGAVSSRPQDISVEAGTVIYDSYNNAIEVTATGTVSQQSTGGMYSLNANTGEKVDLAYNTMAFKDGEYQFFGGGYKINSDGSVDIIQDEDTYVFTNEPMFFKIADRKYVIVGSSIQDEDQTILASDYVFIQLDTVGNAIILSDGINVKTTKPTVLNCENISFDIANEILYYGSIEVNMKNVIASTNTYDSGLYKEVDEEDTPSVYELTITGGSGGTGGTGGTGGDGGDGGDGGVGGTGGVGGSGGDGAFGEDQQSVELAVFTNVVSNSYSSITVDYDFEDPFGAMGMVYVELHKLSDLTFVDNGVTYSLTLDDLYDEYSDNADAVAIYNADYFNSKHRYSITSYDDEYTFYGLDAYTDYYVVMISSSVDSFTYESSTVVKDYVKVRTMNADNSISVQTTTSSYIEVLLSLDGISFYEPGAEIVVNYSSGSDSFTVTEEDALTAVTDGYLAQLCISSSEYYYGSDYITINYQIGTGTNTEIICSAKIKNGFYGSSAGSSSS